MWRDDSAVLDSPPDTDQWIIWIFLFQTATLESHLEKFADVLSLPLLLSCSQSLFSCKISADAGERLS